MLKYESPESAVIYSVDCSFHIPDQIFSYLEPCFLVPLLYEEVEKEKSMIFKLKSYLSCIVMALYISLILFFS